MHAHPHVTRTRRHGKHRQAVMARDAGICHLCGGPHADAIDHIVPVSWGGSDDPSNLAPAHTSCNTRKRDARPDAWTWNRPGMWLPGYGPNATTTGAKKGANTDVRTWPKSRVFGFGWTLLWWLILMMIVGLFTVVTNIELPGVVFIPLALLPVWWPLFGAWWLTRPNRSKSVEPHEADPFTEDEWYELTTVHRQYLQHTLNSTLAVVSDEEWRSRQEPSELDEVFAAMRSALNTAAEGKAMGPGEIADWHMQIDEVEQQSGLEQ